jgi:hypothetical protein
MMEKLPPADTTSMLTVAFLRLDFREHVDCGTNGARARPWSYYSCVFREILDHTQNTSPHSLLLNQKSKMTLTNRGYLHLLNRFQPISFPNPAISHYTSTIFL